MPALLDLLARHVGQDKIRRVSGAQGGLYHSPCPACGGTDRFLVFSDQPGGEMAQQHGLPGTWACPRHCGTGGDIIAFVQEFDGLSFQAACAELGISLDTAKGRSSAYRRPLRRPENKNAAFIPKEYSQPVAAWKEHATKLALDAAAAIQDQPAVLDWLAARGLPLEAVLRYRLGWLAGQDKTGTCLYRQRAAFGLPPKMRAGKAVRVFWIPRGITIPDFDADGNCRKLQIRRPNKDIDPAKKHDPKYLYVPQPEPVYTAPHLFPPVGIAPELATWVVVESRLDAMAVHHACGGRVGVLAVLSVSTRPDVVAHAALSVAARILVALDFDAPREDGQPIPTAAAWPWWETTYPQARLWPVPQGKDPGDAFALGVPLWDWVRAGMPLGGDADQGPDGSQGAALFEGDLGGEGGFAGNMGQPLGTAQEACHPVQPWPEYFGDWMPPAAVIALAKYWPGKPVEFHKTEDGGGGWRWDPRWSRRCPQACHDFLTLGESEDVWRWMDEHSAQVINSRNFLWIWGQDG